MNKDAETAIAVIMNSHIDPIEAGRALVQWAYQDAAKVCRGTSVYADMCMTERRSTIYDCAIAIERRAQDG